MAVSPLETIHEVYSHAQELSMATTGESTLAHNCPYNARAVARACTEQNISCRTVRGVVVHPGDTSPEDTDLSLELYAQETGNAHWWVEAELSTGTTWVLDIWSLHPQRYEQALTMADRPPEYRPIEADTTHMSMFDPTITYSPDSN